MEMPPKVPRPQKRQRALPLLLAIAGWAAPAAAMSFEPGVYTWAQAYHNDETAFEWFNQDRHDEGAWSSTVQAQAGGQAAWAYGSLSDAVMRISGSATAALPVNPGNPGEVSNLVHAGVWVYDKLIIDVDQRVATGQLGVVMPYSFDLDGSVSGQAGVSFGYRLDSDWDWTGFSGGAASVTGSVVLHAGQTVLPFAASVQGGAGGNSRQADPGGGSFDLSHTVHLRFHAPPGVTIHSSSGVFPTASAVPEPPVAWLAAGGTLLLCWHRRRELIRP